MPWLLADMASTVAAPLSDAANWNLWISGTVIVALSVAAMTNYRPWEEWTSVFVGAWLIVSPWIFGFTAATAVEWSVWIVGIVLVVAGLWSLAMNGNGRSYAA